MAKGGERMKRVKEKTKPFKKKFTSHLLYIIPLFILLFSLLFKVFTSAREKAQIEAVPIPVRLVSPEKGSLSQEIRLSAYVESRNMVTVLPFVSGIIQELPFEIGDSVQKDDVIAYIDDERFRLQLRQAEAAWLALKSTRERVEQLYRSNATTLQNYEEIKGQAEAAESQYELALLQVKWAEVKSPIDGVVLVRHLSAGSIAAPERPLLTIGSLEDLEVRVRIPERWYQYFANEKNYPAVHLEVDGFKEQIPLNIRALSPFISAETKNFELVLTIPSTEQQLRPGMYVRIIIELERKDNVWTLPERALGSGNKLWYVHEGRAQSVDWIPPFRSDSAFMLAEELSAQDYIVEGQFFLREGSPVTVLP